MKLRKNRLLSLLLLFPAVLLFSGYEEGEDGDWVWTGKEPEKTGEKKPKQSIFGFTTPRTDKPPKMAPLVLTNKCFTFADMNFRYNRPLFGNSFKTLEANTSLMHISHKRALYKASFSWLFQLSEEKIMNQPFAATSNLDTWGFTGSILYGHPLSVLLSRNTIQLVTLDFGGVFSLYGSSDDWLKMDAAFIAETRSGIRYLKTWSKDTTRFSHFSLYLHLALQYRWMEGDVFSPNSPTPEIPIYRFDEKGFRPQLIAGLEIKVFMFTINAEFLFIEPAFSGLTLGLGISF
jgi:hypothetical protein